MRKQAFLSVFKCNTWVVWQIDLRLNEENLGKHYCKAE